MFGKKKKETKADEQYHNLHKIIMEGRVNNALMVDGLLRRLQEVYDLVAHLRAELKDAKANPQVIRTKSVHVTVAR